MKYVINLRKTWGKGNKNQHCHGAFVNIIIFFLSLFFHSLVLMWYKMFWLSFIWEVITCFLGVNCCFQHYFLATLYFFSVKQNPLICILWSGESISLQNCPLVTLNVRKRLVTKTKTNCGPGFSLNPGPVIVLILMNQDDYYMLLVVSFGGVGVGAVVKS